MHTCEALRQPALATGLPRRQNVSGGSVSSRAAWGQPRSRSRSQNLRCSGSAQQGEQQSAPAQAEGSGGRHKGTAGANPNPSSSSSSSGSSSSRAAKGLFGSNNIVTKLVQRQGAPRDGTSAEQQQQGDGAPPTWPNAAARQGLYSDVAAERVDALHARVIGKLPPWLQGSFYRNGPGKFEGVHAVFDGCAMLVRFRLDGSSNEVVLSHRFLESVYYKAVKDLGHVKWKMAHPPESGRSTLEGLAYAGGLALGALQYGHMGDNALISILPQGNELIAHTETVFGTYRVHPDTLETLGRVHYRDSVHGMVKTAHPQRLPCGDIIGIAADFSPVLDKDAIQMKLPEITVYRQSRWQYDRRHKIASVPYMRPTAPTWIHQVPVSEHYAVVVQNPVFYNVKAMVLGQATKFMVFDWDPKEHTLLHVVPLLGGPVKTFHAPAFLATHWVNAFESPDGRLLHLDAAVTDDPGLMSHWDLQTVRSGQEGGKQIERSGLRRLIIDLSLPDGSFINEQPLLQPLASDADYGYAFEMPSINPHNACKPYRFAYGTSCVRPTNCWNAICKVDTHTREVKMWHEAGGAAWEPVFVPKPGAKAEDEGCVLSTIMQPDGRSALLVLDARSFKEVARAVLPYALPNGFHGCFVPT